MVIVLKRIYETPEPSDGFRLLVDRLWPRGVSKERAALDLWLKEVAPSTELRTWFAHREDRFAEFSDRYVAELEENPAVADVRRIVRENPRVTLLFSARDPLLNQAAVLRDHLT